MRFAIFGSGGVGGYFGGRLAQSGNDVTFIARGDNLRALRSTGLTVESFKGDFVVSSPKATDDTSQVNSVDVVIVGVKAWQVAEAARMIKRMVGPNTCVLPLQNGVEAAAQLSSVLGEAHVLGGLCRIVAYLVGPGHIRHAGFEPSIAFGELDNSVSARVESVRDAFANAGVDVTVPSDIQEALWNKFLFISGFSGVGAVTRAPVGIVRRLPQTRSLLERAMREIHAVGHARGIKLPADAVDLALATVDALPDNATSSMQRDFIANRPSELEAQNGAVVRLGQEVGVETTVNSFVYNSLLPLELKARGQLSFPG
ncbi:MAG TPA: 2-dehydropantoate 2-reductase [Pyrinomonadaceae bacterium]